MATIQFKKGDEYLAKLTKLEALTRDEIIGTSLYGAADIVANEIRSQLNQVPTDEGGYGSEGRIRAGPTKGQVKSLKATLGIASLQVVNGLVNVKIGWDGYNQIKTNRWPHGQPNQMVARSIERGTSFMQKHMFVSKAVKKTSKTALEFMRKNADAKIRELMQKRKG